MQSMDHFPIESILTKSTFFDGIFGEVLDKPNELNNQDEWRGKTRFLSKVLNSLIAVECPNLIGMILNVFKCVTEDTKNNHLS